MHYDVVVAGGGTAGCVLAGRLREDAARTVCLVEAGPDYGPYDEGAWPTDILDVRRLALDSHCWERSDEEDRSHSGHASSGAARHITPACSSAPRTRTMTRI